MQSASCTGCAVPGRACTMYVLDGDAAIVCAFVSAFSCVRFVSCSRICVCSVEIVLGKSTVTGMWQGQ